MNLFAGFALPFHSSVWDWNISPSATTNPVPSSVPSLNMPRYLSLRSKSHHVVEEEVDRSQEESSSVSSGQSQTPQKSRVKEMSVKAAARSVRRSVRRLDEILHHVTHTKHEETPRRRTVSVPSRPPTTIPSFRRGRTSWSKYPKDHDSSSSSGSQDSLPVPPQHRRTTSAEIAVQTDDIMADRKEHSLPEPPVASEEAEDSPPFVSSPTVFVESEAPDPFLVDEEGDALSDEGKDSSVHDTPSPVAQNVLLDQPLSPPPELQGHPLMSPLPNLNKDIPPPPPTTDTDNDDDQDDDEEEVPDLYVPSLILPTMFLPIPNTDPLTTLLNKYIYPPERRPPRDLTGDWQRSDFHTMVMTNSWRALARMARDRLVVSDASDLTLILGLWHLRLSCLARLRLFNQTSAECTNLFTALASIEPPEARTYVYDRILPFELEVMQTRLKYWAGDHMGYLDALSALLKKCRMKGRAASVAASSIAKTSAAAGVAADESLVPMWKERGARVALILASQMVEMKEIIAAARLLEPLASQPEPSPVLRSSIARIYLQGGYLPAAKKHFALVEADPTAEDGLKMVNKGLVAAAEGDWEASSEVLRALLEKDGENYVAVNNLAVALLSQGKLKEGIDVLERALQASPLSVVVAEPFLFNLSTLYELRATVGTEKKKDLLISVAKWSGDGLRTNSLKMPAN